MGVGSLNIPEYTCLHQSTSKDASLSGTIAPLYPHTLPIGCGQFVDINIYYAEHANGLLVA